MQNNGLFRILFLGDIVGPPGLEALADNLLDWRAENNIDMVVANGENISGGSGISVKNTKELLRIGIDVITSGDHIWRHKDFADRLDEFPFIIRPANYPDGVPGRGFVVWSSMNGVSVGVINLMGRVFMYPIECPFKAVDNILEQIKNKADIIIVDFHAEATSEKKAMGYYLKGRVSAVFGTHTHIPTADLSIDEGTAYMTDVGMCGPKHSILGREPDAVLKKFHLGIPVRFPVAKFPVIVQGVLVDVNKENGEAVKAVRWEKNVSGRK